MMARRTAMLLIACPSYRLVFGYHQPERPVVARHLAKIAVPVVPRSGVEVHTKPVDDLLLDPWLEKCPHRLRGTDLRVKQSPGAVPKCFEEPIDAVARSTDALDLDLTAQRMGDLSHRGESRSLDVEPRGKIILLRGGKIVEFESEHHDA